MTVAKFIAELANSFSDNNYQIFDQEEWKDILNFQLKALSPDIQIRTTTEVSYDSSTMQVDLSGSTYSNLIDVEAVLLENSEGKFVEYNSWSYLPEKEVLDLDPDSYKDNKRYVGDYEKVYIRWSHYADELDTETDSLPINYKHLDLLKEMCKKEALSRVLMDKVKFKRYQVYAGDVSHYFVLSLIKESENKIMRAIMTQRDNDVGTF